MSISTAAGSTEALFRLLAPPQRRAILHHLRESGETSVSVDELVEAVSTGTAGSADRIGPRERERLRIALHHVHLPGLADAGTINYDAHTERVRYTPVDRVESLLQFVGDELED